MEYSRSPYVGITRIRFYGSDLSLSGTPFFECAKVIKKLAFFIAFR